MVKVGWLQSSIGIKGGAELSCGALVQNAPEWAEVIYCRPNRRPPPDIGCFILQNSTTYGDHWIEELCLAPVVRHVRDPWYAGSAILRRWLCENAALMVFSSQTQRDTMGYDIQVPVEFIPPPVDLRPFKKAAQVAAEEGVKRQGSVFVGRVDVYKGAPAVVDWALRKGEPIAFVGEVMMGFGNLPPFIQFLGKVPYQKMPWILARAERLVAMPEWPEAFGRGVVEAWAAGCELFVEGRVGAMEWIDNEPDRLGFDGPIAEFWAAVEGVL